MRIRPAIILQDNNNRIMLLRYFYSGKDVYQFPGGNIEGIESLEETLKRELQEELNLPVQINNLLISAQVINEEKLRATLHCLFSGTIVGQAKPIINPDQTSALEVVWMETDKLDQLNLYPAVGTKLKSILQSNTGVSYYLGLIDQPWF
jgi:8-oxo-dGTP diphosphatase